MIGYTPEDWLASPTFWNEHIHSDDRQQVVEASARADREGTSFKQEYRIIAKDGRIVWVRDEAWAVAVDANGRPELMQGVMYDITQQKEAEERTQDAENRYRMIVERVPTVAYSWDSADAPGTAPAAYISPQIQRLLGYYGTGVARGPDAVGIARASRRSRDDVAGVGVLVRTRGDVHGRVPPADEGRALGLDPGRGRPRIGRRTRPTHLLGGDVRHHRAEARGAAAPAVGRGAARRDVPGQRAGSGRQPCAPVRGAEDRGAHRHPGERVDGAARDVGGVDPPGRPRARPGGEPPDGALGRALRDRVPVPAARRDRSCGSATPR